MLDGVRDDVVQPYCKVKILLQETTSQVNFAFLICKHIHLFCLQNVSLCSKENVLLLDFGVITSVVVCSGSTNSFDGKAPQRPEWFLFPPAWWQ